MKVAICDDVDIEENDAREMTEIVQGLAGVGTKYVVLLDATRSFTISPEARTWIASKQHTTNRVAAAFVVNSLANRLLGNFFIKFNKPHSPTKLFNTEEDALVWLKEQLRKVNL